MRRVVCIALPQIRVEIAQEKENAAHGPAGIEGDASLRDHASREEAPRPLAVVVARPGGAVRSERDILGNTRLDVVSREARANGVRVGQTVAAARAKCADLRVRVVAESAVCAGLARVAEVSLAFGPMAAFDIATDVVWVEIGGCAHLQGGEIELVNSLVKRVLALGHACRVAIADGPRIASAVARFGARRNASRDSTLASMPDCVVHIVPGGMGAEAMRALPVEALGLQGADSEDLVVWLRDLGLRTCGDLQNLPRRSLGARLGARTKDVMQLLSGEDRAPLDAWRPTEVPEERIELDWGATSVEALAFVTRVLCDRLAARLEGRAMAASRLGFVLGLDRGLLGEGVPPTLAIDVALPVPIARPVDLFAVVRTRLDRVELPAPVLTITLRALELSSATPRPLDLLAPAPKAERALAPLVAELAADLGVASVGTLTLADKWSPEDRTRLALFGSAPDPAARQRAGAADEPSSLVASSLEPSRLVRSPRSLCRSLDSFDGVTPLARLEAVEWWRRSRPQRDFCAAWDGSALAWIEVRNATVTGETATGERACWVRGWID